MSVGRRDRTLGVISNTIKEAYDVVACCLSELDPVTVTLSGDLPCRVSDPELWFAESPVQLEMAKALCRECPVRRACLRGAIARREPWGVWGGEIFDNGVIVSRKRPRGRPRKTDRVPVQRITGEQALDAVDGIAS
jgi:WhiB family redox-sensing transcriptional regulator